MTLEEYIQTEPSSSGQFQRRLRIFFANLAVALGWALKRSCKGCAHRLFATARWLVPEAERFLVLHLHSHNRHRRMSNFMGDLGVLLSRMQALRIAAGFMIVLFFSHQLILSRGPLRPALSPSRRPHRYSLNLKSHQKISEASGRLRILGASQRRKAKQFHCLHVNSRRTLGKEWLSKNARDQRRCLEGKSEQSGLLARSVPRDMKGR